MTPDENWWLKTLAYAVFAAFGGLMGHIMRSFDDNEKIQLGRVIVHTASAGFVGVLVLLACVALDVGYYWTGVIVGVSGWLGANASIRMLEQLVFKRLGIDKREQ